MTFNKLFALQPFRFKHDINSFWYISLSLYFLTDIALFANRKQIDLTSKKIGN